MPDANAPDSVPAPNPTRNAPTIFVPEEMGAIRGMPEGWQWRGQQRDIVSRILNSPKKVILLEAEVGIGKSPIAIAVLRTIQRNRSAVLVLTRQLEDQYLRDFPRLAKIEGRRWFTCDVTGETADNAPCTVGFSCPMSGKINSFSGEVVEEATCSYYAAKHAAIRNDVSIHNYAYFLNETRNSKSPFRKLDWLVCDEGHELQSVLVDAAGIEIAASSLRNAQIPLPPYNATMEQTAEWARRAQLDLQEQKRVILNELEDLGIEVDETDEGEIRFTIIGLSGFNDEDSKRTMQETFGRHAVKSRIARFKALGSLLSSIDLVRGVALRNDGTWVIDRRDDSKFILKPIFPNVGFRRLMDSAKRILIMSAYLAPELLAQNLGLSEDDYEIIKADRVYDRTKSPILFTPMAKLNKDTPEYQWQRLVVAMDCIIDYHGTKGLIHVPSLDLRNRILRMSRHADKMITYEANGRDGLSKDEALERFRFTDSPDAILLGQSIHTGVDLPYVPQWQIIVKMPFPPTNDPAIKARMTHDRSYYDFITICPLVQAVGRIKRAADHDGPTYIMDDQFRWFYSAHKDLFPAWFNDSFKWKGWALSLPIVQALRARNVTVPL